ncbi:MAG: hypothetical protein ABRQ39_24580 [Candidatus Eremiobacterota bacterium]
MKHPDFFYRLKYMRESFSDELIKKPEVIPQILRTMKKEISDFNNAENNLKKIKAGFDIILHHIISYEQTNDDKYLQEIQKICRHLACVSNDIYKEITFFERLTHAREKAFIRKEAVKRAENSSMFIGLAALVNAGKEGTMPEEELWEQMDMVRETIYDIQEGEPEDLSDKTKHHIDIAGLFKSGLEELEGALDMIERAFQDKNNDDADHGLLKALDGLVKLKMVDVIGAIGGVIQ